MENEFLTMSAYLDKSIVLIDEINKEKTEDIKNLLISGEVNKIELLVDVYDDMINNVVAFKNEFLKTPNNLENLFNELNYRNENLKNDINVLLDNDIDSIGR